MSAPIPEDLKKNWNAAVFFGEPACTGYRALIDRIATLEQELSNARSFLGKLSIVIRSSSRFKNNAGLAAENAALKAQVARLLAPVSDEEWQDYAIPFSGVFAAIQRDGVDRVIAARAKEE